MWILDLVDCLSCDSTDLRSRKLFCCGILWILNLVSGLCYGILGILDPVEPFLPSDPVDLGSCFFGHGTCLTPMRLGQSVQKFKIQTVTFHRATLCILLHLLSWENRKALNRNVESSVSKALNPAGFTAFDKFLKDGADVKDCSRSNILFNQF